MRNQLVREKAEHERIMMRKFCDHFVPRVMEEHGLEFFLTHNKKATVIGVHIRDNKWAEFRLRSFKGEEFIPQIQKIPEQVKAIKALYETLDIDVAVTKRPNPE